MKITETDIVESLLTPDASDECIELDAEATELHAYWAKALPALQAQTRAEKASHERVVAGVMAHITEQGTKRSTHRIYETKRPLYAGTYAKALAMAACALFVVGYMAQYAEWTDTPAPQTIPQEGTVSASTPGDRLAETLNASSEGSIVLVEEGIINYPLRISKPVTLMAKASEV